MEQARAEAAMDSAHNKPCERKFFFRDIDFAKFEAELYNRYTPRAAAFSGVYTGPSDRVSNCIGQINLSKKARLTCPKCGNTDWRRFIFNSDPQVTDPDTVGRCCVMCVADQGTAQFGGGPVTCGAVNTIYDLMDSRDHPLLHKDVADWMQQKGIALPGPNSFPSPYAATMPNLQEFTVSLVCCGQHFNCKIVMAEPIGGSPPSVKDAEQAAEKMWGSAIKNYVQSGGQTPLPSTIQHVGGSGYAGVQPGQYPQFKSAVAPAPTCEADKPEGTRDVDAFLREQQDRLWRGD